MLLFAQAARGAVVSSITFDEGPHLAVGYATLRSGDFRLQPVHIHPPLTNMLAGAPLLLDASLPDPRTIPGWDIASLSAVTDTIVWQHRSPDKLALAGRIPIILLAVLLGALVYRWATDLGGPGAGRLALLLYALDPNVVAHAQLITTDTGVTAFGFAAFYLYFKACRSKSGPHRRMILLVAGAALGAALASKVSAGLIVPLLSLIVVLPGLAGRDTLLRRLGQLVLISVAAFGMAWAVYGFEIARVPGFPIPLPAATHLKIYQSLQQHYNEGHPAFLMGMNATHGWWFYFPVAFLIKTPLPTLLLLAAAARLEIPASLRLKFQSLNTLPLEKYALLIFPVLHFATALFSSVNIGYRHLLPILPFLFVTIGVQIGPWVTGYKLRVASCRSEASSDKFPVVQMTIYILLLWYALSAALTFPHNLAYFNLIAGGPDGGYRWLVDSNLDWGQNLKELKRWLDARGISHIFLSQFSPARPEVYGLQADMLPPSPRSVSFALFDPAPGWYAIGASTLQGVYTPDVDTFAYFRSLTPTARMGHALFVYEVKPGPSPDWVAVCASPAAVLGEDELRAGFANDALRIVNFDCANAWVQPAGEGRYALPRPEPGSAGTFTRQHLDTLPTLVTRQRAPGGQAVAIYRAYPQDIGSLQPGVALDGPLNYLGARLTSVAPNKISLETSWQATGVPTAPLSLMAHLLSDDGNSDSVVAVGDGLGVPPEQWQAGDVIIQRHDLNPSASLPPGAYWIQTGAYWILADGAHPIGLRPDQVMMTGDGVWLTPVEIKP